mmetsp:Transcript_125612/g.217823  ORF Transcript_125612/g.217823 Transcript_125612/m.217823 type:complete len:135 (-) Transcript_125612:732-1136(-)
MPTWGVDLLLCTSRRTAVVDHCHVPVVPMSLTFFGLKVAIYIFFSVLHMNARQLGASGSTVRSMVTFKIKDQLKRYVALSKFHGIAWLKSLPHLTHPLGTHTRTHKYDTRNAVNTCACTHAHTTHAHLQRQYPE